MRTTGFSPMTAQRTSVIFTGNPLWLIEGIATQPPSLMALRIPHRAVGRDRERTRPPLERVALERVDVQIDAEARPGRQLEVSVDQLHRLVDQVAPRRLVVRVVFEDEEVRRTGREVDVHRR